MKFKLAVSGHRSGFDFALVEAKLRAYFTKYIDDIECVYVGMALGFDTLVAQVCIDLDIPMIGCVPFKGHHSRWPQRDLDIYREIVMDMKASDNCQFRIVTPRTITEYRDACKALFARNEYMIDNADKLLVCYDGREKGGTSAAIEYAKKKGKPVGNIL